MARLWDIIRRGGGKSEKRDNIISMDDWAMMFQGNTYPLGMMARQGNREDIDNDFSGYVNACYKSNGIVFACMMRRMLIFCEARFQFQRISQGRAVDLFGNQDLAILEKPWANGTTGDLLARAIQDVDLSGNFFCVEEGFGVNRRLRRLRPDWVEIVLDVAPEDAVRSNIVGYVYKPGGITNRNEQTWEIYPVDGSNGNVVHWAPVPDPSQQYMGMSWITPIIREIISDKAATLHKGKFFENAATPNIAVSFSDQLTVDQFKEFMETLDATKGGVEHAYETLYLGGGATVVPIGADLRQLDFKNTQGAGETRIAAAAGVHPVLVGLSEGMQGSALNAGNYESVKRNFGDTVLRPMWRSLAAALEVVVKVPANCRLWYDDRDIAFLRSDRNALSNIQHTQQQTIAGFVMNGFEPQSAVDAVLKEDFTLLKHTGLYSVQLLPPGDGTMNSPPTGNTPIPPGGGKQPPAAGAPAAKTTPPKKPAPASGAKKPARDDGRNDDDA